MVHFFTDGELEFILFKLRTKVRLRLFEIGLGINSIVASGQYEKRNFYGWRVCEREGGSTDIAP